MSIIEQIKTSFFAYLKNSLALSQDVINTIEINLNIDPSKQQFGDLTTNAALIGAKELKTNPRELAQKIVNTFAHEAIDKAEIAGPGFVNIFLKPQAFSQIAKELWQDDQSFFKPSDNAEKHNYNIEFVSANPTGPLHLGHGRGGIIGDVLGNVLRFLNNKVTKEFYINDAGSQIKKLGNSLKIRCQQELGIQVEIPEDGYHGTYLIDLANACIKQHGKDLLDNADKFFDEYAKENLLQRLQETLKNYGITFDVWFSELVLHNTGAIEHALGILDKNGYLYKKDDALWFRSTDFGDDKDRVLKKGNGELTYVAADVAYVENKLDRGSDKLVLVLGQDHHSYVVRLKAVMAALGHNPDNLDVILYQLVTLKESGQVLRMSKRAGRSVNLEDVIEEVGTDVARFFYLNRKADAHLEFDIDLALKKTEENPVYYIQYAYVRTKSILQKAYLDPQLQKINADDSALISASENLILKKIASLKYLLETIARSYQTHLLTYYAIELAQTFHSYYAGNRVIDPNNLAQSRGRLLIVEEVNRTLKFCFELLGISAPERM